MNILKRIKSKWNQLFSRGLYVTLDPNDNSITFSPRLWKMLSKEISIQGKAKIIVFSTRLNPHKRHIYGFELNPDLEKETHLADVQYNSKHDCYGFESLVPTVNRIFFDYRVMQYNKPQRFNVEIFYLDCWVPKSLEHAVFFILPPTYETASR